MRSGEFEVAQNCPLPAAIDLNDGARDRADAGVIEAAPIQRDGDGAFPDESQVRGGNAEGDASIPPGARVDRNSITRRRRADGVFDSCEFAVRTDAKDVAYRHDEGNRDHDFNLTRGGAQRESPAPAHLALKMTDEVQSTLHGRDR